MRKLSNGLSNSHPSSLSLSRVRSVEGRRWSDGDGTPSALVAYAAATAIAFPSSRTHAAAVGGPASGAAALSARFGGCGVDGRAGLLADNFADLAAELGLPTTLREVTRRCAGHCSRALPPGTVTGRTRAREHMVERGCTGASGGAQAPHPNDLALAACSHVCMFACLLLNACIS